MIVELEAESATIVVGEAETRNDEGDKNSTMVELDNPIHLAVTFAVPAVPQGLRVTLARPFTVVADVGDKELMFDEKVMIAPFTGSPFLS